MPQVGSAIETSASPESILLVPPPVRAQTCAGVWRNGEASGCRQTCFAGVDEHVRLDPSFRADAFAHASSLHKSDRCSNNARALPQVDGMAPDKSGTEASRDNRSDCSHGALTRCARLASTPRTGADAAVLSQSLGGG